jgi:hypothetical protein
MKFNGGLLVLLLLMLPLKLHGQTPTEIFDLSNEVVGPQKIATKYFSASGKWSDADSKAGPLSTDIHCYKRLGFCEVASALTDDLGDTVLRSETFDIEGWDGKEMIAAYRSPICEGVDYVATLRVDFTMKTVVLSYRDRVSANVPHCGLVDGAEKAHTAVLLDPMSRKLSSF